MGEEVAKISKGVATNENEIGVEFELENFKVWLGKIRWSWVRIKLHVFE